MSPGSRMTRSADAIAARASARNAAGVGAHTVGSRRDRWTRRPAPTAPVSTELSSRIPPIAAGRSMTGSPAGEIWSALPTTAVVRPSSASAVPRAPGTLDTSVPASAMARGPSGSTISPVGRAPRRRSITSAAVESSTGVSAGNAKAAVATPRTRVPADMRRVRLHRGRPRAVGPHAGRSHRAFVDEAVEGRHGRRSRGRRGPGAGCRTPPHAARAPWPGPRTAGRSATRRTSPPRSPPPAPRSHRCASRWLVTGGRGDRVTACTASSSRPDPPPERDHLGFAQGEEHRDVRGEADRAAHQQGGERLAPARPTR